MFEVYTLFFQEVDRKWESGKSMCFIWINLLWMLQKKKSQFPQIPFESFSGFWACFELICYVWGFLFN